MKTKVLIEHRLSDAFSTPAIMRSKQQLFLEQDAHPSYQLARSLTQRELEVLVLVAEGYTDRKIAEILVISPRTVHRHLSNIYIKLNVPGRTAAVICAMLQGAFV